MILNENDYQAFVASIDLLSLHCPDASIFIGQVKHLEFDLIRNQSH